jgi:formylglycine-generating enzyme required for sulfatase activity
MSSLADLTELVGFFSYSRRDDEYSEGALSRLRARINNDLRLQLGRDFRLWQDVTAIPEGALWEVKINDAIAASSFFIPIVTPSAVISRYCRFEFEAFLKREAALGRSNLIFPILYVRVPALEKEEEWRRDDVLKIIGERQCIDWQSLRYRDLAEPEVRAKIGKYCRNIFEALHQPWVSPEQRRAEEEQAPQEAEERARQSVERQRLAREADERRRAEEAERRAREAEQRREAEEQERQRKAADAARRIEEARRRKEADAALREAKARRTAWLIGGAAIAVVAAVALVYVLQTRAPSEQPVAVSIVEGPLSPDRERALKPKDAFTECSGCPEMLVVPAGSFTMGSPTGETGRFDDEGPPHKVTIAKPFAVSKFTLTFDNWDACVSDGDCDGYQPSDNGWGRGLQPAINVSWNDAKSYVVWLSKKTGKPYRLLTEAEYEYATRAGTQTAYWWGNDIGKGNANCDGCGSRWDNKQTAPAGSFTPNKFGLYDMSGNVWGWVEDCLHDNYQEAPSDGSAWTNACADATRRVVRGGSWYNGPRALRAANRFGIATDGRFYSLGFRLARTLNP